MSQVEFSLKYVLKKWYIILLCVLIGGGLAYVEKGRVAAPPVARNGDLLYSRMVAMSPVPYAVVGNTSKEVDLAEMFESQLGTNYLIAQLEEKADIEKLYMGWKRATLNDKMKWIEKHFFIVHVAPGTYELEIQFYATDAKDTEYVEENSEKLMAILFETVDKLSYKLRSGQELQVIDSTNIIHHTEPVSPQSLQKKYIVIGAVLGGMAGVALLAVMSLGKYRKQD